MQDSNVNVFRLGILVNIKEKDMIVIIDHRLVIEEKEITAKEN